MKEVEREVVVLKPTQAFLTFLSAQLPSVELPEFSLLQTDYTAYSIYKQDSEEATLDEIEKHFPTMFRQEIKRWLGDDICDDIHGSFLDFLCCFKFELHSQIVLMEPTFTDGHQLLCVKPRSVMLKWVKSTIEEQPDVACVLERVNLSHITENATVLVKNFNDLIDIKPFLQQYYRAIFKAEMIRMSDVASSWPEMDSFQTFSQYFAVEIHTQLIHLQ